MKINWNKGSFRDPSNRIFESEGKIYRAIFNSGKSDYINIQQSGIIQKLINKNYLIDTDELDRGNKLYSHEELKNVYIILKHKKIPFISYPYEWCFEQLKKAAIFHLDLQLYLLENNFNLKDSSAFNIQFIGGEPIFIDFFSLQKYNDGDYWIGYKQFCENFLNPLYLSFKKNVQFNHIIRSNLEGISSTTLNNLLSFKDKLSLNVFSHIVLQSRYEKKVLLDEKSSIKKFKKLKKLPKKNLISMITIIKNWIKKFNIQNKKSTWSDYSVINTYKDFEKKKKIDIVKKFTNKIKPNLLVDLGCNTGDYSIAALENGANYVVGFDFDIESLNKSYDRSPNFLPLWFDAANPSPDQGFMQKERDGFERRVKSDALISLAFIHHLVIAKNISVKMFVEWISKISQFGLLEFVPKNDETIQKMLISKRDIYKDYNIDNLIKYLEYDFKIVSIDQVSESGRKIIEYSKK
tara:strand:- start:71 stop:1462 length:1392 start_codon:yes stop_codon:yes gene_type:complete